MVKEQYVSFETSKLLKEKGFDISVYSYYSRDGELHPMNEYGNSVNFNNSILEYMERLSAPTQALVCTWLREKYDYCVIVRPDCEGRYYYIIYAKDKDGNFVSMFYQENLSNVYKKALENGIQYCLENLIEYE